MEKRKQMLLKLIQVHRIIACYQNGGKDFHDSLNHLLKIPVLEGGEESANIVCGYIELWQEMRHR